MATPRLRYQTIEFGGIDVHLCTLRDRQQFHDPDGTAENLGISSAAWPLFGVVWPSSLALATYMDAYDTADKRILEVGCGIGLPSLLLRAKAADITATDQHPAVADFLLRNSGINAGVAAIGFERTGWADHNDSLGRFDLIIGSDLLYEDAHTELLAAFIDAHAQPACEVIVVDPGRGRKTKLILALGRCGFTCAYQTHPLGLADDFKGYILKFAR